MSEIPASGERTRPRVLFFGALAENATGVRGALRPPVAVLLALRARVPRSRPASRVPGCEWGSWPCSPRRLLERRLLARRPRFRQDRCRPAGPRAAARCSNASVRSGRGSPSFIGGPPMPVTSGCSTPPPWAAVSAPAIMTATGCRTCASPVRRAARGCTTTRASSGSRTSRNGPACARIDTAWTTGASFANLDGDGHLDLFVCYAGPNRFYRNRGDGTFREEAAAWGLDFSGASMMMAFADYDRDGRLDGYLLTAGLMPNASQKFRVKFVDGRPTVPEELQEFWQMFYLPGDRAAMSQAGQFRPAFPQRRRRAPQRGGRPRRNPRLRFWQRRPVVGLQRRRLAGPLCGQRLLWP